MDSSSRDETAAAPPEHTGLILQILQHGKSCPPLSQGPPCRRAARPYPGCGFFRCGSRSGRPPALPQDLDHALPLGAGEGGEVRLVDRDQEVVKVLIVQGQDVADPARQRLKGLGCDVVLKEIRELAVVVDHLVGDLGDLLHDLSDHICRVAKDRDPGHRLEHDRVLEKKVLLGRDDRIHAAMVPAADHPILSRVVQDRELCRAVQDQVVVDSNRRALCAPCQLQRCPDHHRDDKSHPGLCGLSWRA